MSSEIDVLGEDPKPLLTEFSNLTPPEASPRVKFINVLILGFAFMFIFTAFQSTNMMQKNVINGRIVETNGTYTGDAYLSMGISSLVFAFAIWFTPSVIYTIGAKWSLLLGASPYCLYIFSWIEPWTWALYMTSVLNGFGSSLLWTTQGVFLTLNSDAHTITRNTGILFGMQQSSAIWGNLFEFFVLRGEDSFTADKRHLIFIVFSVIVVIGWLLLFCLRPVRNTKASKEKKSFADGFQNFWGVCLTTNMMYLTVNYSYIGLELTYWGGVLTSCVGQNLWLGSDAKSMIGLVGVAIGVGEASGNIVATILGKNLNYFGRSAVILVAFSCHTLGYYLSYITLPNHSPMQESMEPTLLSNDKVATEVVSIIIGVLLGLGDALYILQLQSLLSVIYAADPSPAFARCSFTQSIFAAASFFYSNYVTLAGQLTILVTVNLCACISFMLVDRRTKHLTTLKPEEKPKSSSSECLVEMSAASSQKSNYETFASS